MTNRLTRLDKVVNERSGGVSGECRSGGFGSHDHRNPEHPMERSHWHRRSRNGWPIRNPARGLSDSARQGGRTNFRAGLNLPSMPNYLPADQRDASFAECGTAVRVGDCSAGSGGGTGRFPLFGRVARSFSRQGGRPTRHSLPPRSHRGNVPLAGRGSGSPSMLRRSAGHRSRLKSLAVLARAVRVLWFAMGGSSR